MLLSKLSLLAGLVVLLSLSAQAQGAGDKVEVFGGYSYMHVDTVGSLNGWELSGQYKLTGWLGGVADFDGHYGDGLSVHSFLFGPQVSFPARVSPFAHVLFGGAHASANGGGSSTSFAMGLGGGFDTRIFPAFDWRIIQLDYLPTFFGSTRQDNARVSTGIVIRF